MFKKICMPLEKAADYGRRLYVWGQVTQTAFLQDPRQRRFYMLGLAFGAGLMLMGRSAHAEGFADMANTAASQADTGKAAWGKILTAGGFMGAGYGGYNWYRKGKEGESSRISAGQIIVPLLAGSAMGATGVLMIKAGETIGLSASSQGQIP